MRFSSRSACDGGFELPGPLEHVYRGDAAEASRVCNHTFRHPAAPHCRLPRAERQWLAVLAQFRPTSNRNDGETVLILASAESFDFQERTNVEAVVAFLDSTKN